MRLLNTKTYKLQVVEGDVPPYAILSHTWGKEEVTLQDLSSNTSVHLHGWDKIVRSCNRASIDGWEYIWIDTCCIDKTNTAELGEAINSMFRWYEEAQICYAYLADVPPRNSPAPLDPRHRNEIVPWAWHFRSSRWFKRGWTLQELLAPPFLLFLDKTWNDIGSREQFADEVQKATGIKVKHLTDFNNCCVATKLSWAANRETTRKEDEAYCLLGLLGVYMPLIYGEGNAAFIRLQHELIRKYNDETIFAWGSKPVTGRMYPSSAPLKGIGVLATSPKDFEYWDDLYPTVWPFDRQRQGFTITNAGLTINAELWRISRNFDNKQSLFVLRLNCTWAWPPLERARSPLVLFLQAVEPEPYVDSVPYVFKRIYGILSKWSEIDSDRWENVGRHTIFILESREQLAKASTVDIMVNFKVKDPEIRLFGGIQGYSYDAESQSWVPNKKDITAPGVQRARLAHGETIATKVAVDMYHANNQGVTTSLFGLLISFPARFPVVNVVEISRGPWDVRRYLDRDKNLPFTSSVGLENGTELTASIMPTPTVSPQGKKEISLELVKTADLGRVNPPPIKIFPKKPKAALRVPLSSQSSRPASPASPENLNYQDNSTSTTQDQKGAPHSNEQRYPHPRDYVNTQGYPGATADFVGPSVGFGGPSAGFSGPTAGFPRSASGFADPGAGYDQTFPNLRRYSSMNQRRPPAHNYGNQAHEPPSSRDEFSNNNQYFYNPRM